MRNLFTLMAFAIAVLLVAQPLIYGQEKAAEQKVFEGQLTKVDTTAKLISVKGSNGPEMVFNYDDQTQVLGPVKDVQGLAGNSGTALKVTYRQDRGSNLATRIEVLEKTPPR
jgi:hypothetical protein